MAKYFDGTTSIVIAGQAHKVRRAPPFRRFDLPIAFIADLGTQIHWLSNWWRNTGEFMAFDLFYPKPPDFGQFHAQYDARQPFDINNLTGGYFWNFGIKPLIGTNAYLYGYAPVPLSAVVPTLTWKDNYIFPPEWWIYQSDFSSGPWTKVDSVSGGVFTDNVVVVGKWYAIAGKDSLGNGYGYQSRPIQGV